MPMTVAMTKEPGWQDALATVTDEKYRVTMTAANHQAVDYVPASILEAYVKDARQKWSSVVISDEPDYGPGGPDGETVIPAHLI
jgi:hypothetical protein